MLFKQVELPGVYQIDLDKHHDERGFFARTWCEKEFKAQGLVGRMVQNSIAYNAKKGTLRGMHYQSAPSKQSRLVRCIAGSVFTVIIDLRPESPAYLNHIVDEMTAESHKAYYIPPGFALGYQTLEDDSIVYYQMPEFYEPDFEKGFRWNDPRFSIKWPLNITVINDRDKNYSDFDLKMVAGFKGYYKTVSKNDHG